MCKKAIDRRSFLKLSGQSALAASMFGSLHSFADIMQKEDHFFVVLQMEGGWDISLGVDPWMKSELPDARDMFIEYGLSQTYQSGSLALGPAAMPMKSFVNEMAIVNGIFLSDKDNGHTASLNYMLTGKTSNAANMEVEIARASQRVGNLGILSDSGVNTFNRNIPVTTVYGLTSAYRSREDGSSLKAFLDQNSPKTALAAAQKYMANSSHKMKQLFKLLDGFNLDENENLRNAKILAASFLSGNAFNGHLDISNFTAGGLDSHSSHEGNHLNTQRESWSMLAEILNFFKKTAYGNSGESLFDRTTFIVVSDFSRTPALNAAKGKDHNPMTNSAVLIGKGIRGGRSIGESKLITRKVSKSGMSYHIAKPFDFDQGVAINSRVSGSQFITPENIAVTLGKLFDVDMNMFDTYSKDVRALDQILS